MCSIIFRLLNKIYINQSKMYMIFHLYVKIQQFYGFTFIPENIVISVILCYGMYRYTAVIWRSMFCWYLSIHLSGENAKYQNSSDLNLCCVKIHIVLYITRTPYLSVLMYVKPKQNRTEIRNL